jgi:hypothetical protein
MSAYGIEIPKPEPLPQVALGAVGFSVSRRDAPEWWHRLRAVSDRTGYWPLLIDSPDALSGIDGPPPGAAERLTAAAAVDIETAVSGTLDSLPEDQVAGLLADWPEEICKFVNGPFASVDGPDISLLLVALVPAEHGWQIPAMTGFGDFNNCPPPAVHSAILRRWHERYGAELTCMTYCGFELILARPPSTRREALALALEYAGYCQDGSDNLYGAETVPALAAALLDADCLITWWD